MMMMQTRHKARSRVAVQSHIIFLLSLSLEHWLNHHHPIHRIHNFFFSSFLYETSTLHLSPFSLSPSLGNWRLQTFYSSRRQLCETLQLRSNCNVCQIRFSLSRPRADDAQSNESVAHSSRFTVPLLHTPSSRAVWKSVIILLHSRAPCSPRSSKYASYTRKKRQRESSTIFRLARNSLNIAQFSLSQLLPNNSHPDFVSFHFFFLIHQPKSQSLSLVRFHSPPCQLLDSIDKMESHFLTSLRRLSPLSRLDIMVCQERDSSLFFHTQHTAHVRLERTKTTFRLELWLQLAADFANSLE